MTHANTPTRVLIATATGWPTSSRLAYRLLRNGCEVSAICPLPHILQRVHGIEKIYPYRRIDSLASLHKAITASKAEFVVPCTDGVVWQLHALHQREPSLRPIIERSVGAPEQFPIVRSRFEMLSAAQRLGIRIPRTEAVKRPEDLTSWFDQNKGDRAVVKMDGAWGGIGVKITSSKEEAIAAFHGFSQRPSPVKLLKRVIVDRNPLAVWDWKHAGEPGISVQEFIEGRPANSMIACRDGKVLDALHVEVQSAMSATKAAISIRKLNHPEMVRAAELLTAELKLTGFFGLDYVYGAASDRTWLLELNPRATQIGHLEWLADGRSLVDRMISKWSGNPAAAPTKPIPQDALVVLFPQAASCNLNSPWLRDGVRDIPTEHPELMPEFVPDPNRRESWLRRLAGRFAKGDPIRPVVFTDSGVVQADVLYPPES